MASHPSPLRYPGGKHALTGLLSDVIVANDLHDGTLIEPYAGGAGASLQLLFNELVANIVINDLDPHIYTFWKSVVEEPERLIARLAKASITIEQWRRCQATNKRPALRQRRIDVAFAVLFLNRCNRSGILMGGGPIGGYEQTGNWGIDARFNRDDLSARIRRIAEYRERITVRRRDALSLLNGLKPSTERRIVFLDPPYYNKGQRLYLNSLNHSDHEALASCLLENPPFHWILTYDNVVEIRSLYRSARCVPFELAYTAYTRRVGKELLILDPRLTLPEACLAGSITLKSARR
jgi:DNA adenine methylase